MQHCARPNRRRLQNACRQSGVPGWERWNSTKQRDVSRLWNRGNRSKPSLFKSQNQKPVVALNGDQVDNLRRAKIQTRLYIHTDIKSWDKNCSVGEQKWPTTCIRQNAEILSSFVRSNPPAKVAGPMISPRTKPAAMRTRYLGNLELLRKRTKKMNFGMLR